MRAQDERAQAFLKTLITHEADPDFTDFARQALGGNPPGERADLLTWLRAKV